jgi:hypothetical protein
MDRQTVEFLLAMSDDTLGSIVEGLNKDYYELFYTPGYEREQLKIVNYCGCVQDIRSIKQEAN